jgi:hypothetical protein
LVHLSHSQHKSNQAFKKVLYIIINYIEAIIVSLIKRYIYQFTRKTIDICTIQQKNTYLSENRLMSNDHTLKNSNNELINLINESLNHTVLFFMKKILNYVNSQYTLFYLFVITLLQASAAFSYDEIQNIELSTFGGFKTTFSDIKKVDFIEGHRIIGEVKVRAGENYSVSFPFDVQRIRYHLRNGSLINKGDTVATVEGYDVHHFIDEYKSAQKLLEASENHFQTNRQYFENKTIKSSQWIEITKNYFEAKLNFEHIQHQMSFLNIDENEKITLISPTKGILKITRFSENRLKGDLAFDVIDPSAIQVKLSLPLFNTSSLSHFTATPSCSLAVSSLESVADKYHQTLWASPSHNSDCNLTLGQVIKVTPVQYFKGYKINKSAIFEFENKNYIAIKSESDVVIIKVNLFGAKDNEYYFTANKNVENKKALISSVSILQGHLLNLGAE